MANSCYSVGVVVALLSTVGIMYTLASKMWKQNSAVSSQTSAQGIHSYEGLWIQCISPVPGVLNCDQFDESILGLPAELQGQRAMMCIATAFAVFGVMAGVVGMDCITAMKGTKNKIWTCRAAGGLMLLAGVLTIAACSWYAVGVVDDFRIYQQNQQFNQGSSTFAYEFGSGLYVGWIAGALALIAGGLMVCCSCGGTEDVDEGYRYNYKPAAQPATRAAEYV